VARCSVSSWRSCRVNRVLLVDDHAAFREPLAFMFDREPEFEVVAQAGSLAEARRDLEAIDLAVVDLDLPDGDGTELIGELRAANSQSMVLVLTASVDRGAYARAVEAGAAGVLNKSARIMEVIEAARCLAEGKALLSGDEVVELLRLAAQRRERDHEARLAIEQLTPRELEVLQALADGLSDKEIAERLYVGSGTVRSHVVNIFGKLGVHSRLQALLFAVRHGLIDIVNPD
jgi:DNA-binding NarL/FixJ family response regulator